MGTATLNDVGVDDLAGSRRSQSRRGISRRERGSASASLTAGTETLSGTLQHPVRSWKTGSVSSFWRSVSSSGVSAATASRLAVRADDAGHHGGCPGDTRPWWLQRGGSQTERDLAGAHTGTLLTLFTPPWRTHDTARWESQKTEIR